MYYLDAELDVSYDKAQFQEYKRYLDLSDLNAKDYIEYQVRLRDDHLNMDW